MTWWAKDTALRPISVRGITEALRIDSVVFCVFKMSNVRYSLSLQVQGIWSVVSDCDSLLLNWDLG